MTSGFRTFTAGEVLTASNVQNYLMDQSVMTFAGSAARSSAIGTANFEEGMTSYLKDTDKLEVYNGTNWVGVAPTTTQGLTLINTTSFSAVSSVSLPANTFTSTYNNYEICYSFTGSTAAQVTGRLRAAGVDNSSANYRRANVEGIPVSSSNNTGETSWIVGEVHSSDGQRRTLTFRLCDPATSGVFTSAIITYLSNVNGSPYPIIRWHGVDVTTAYDSMTFIAGAGTITGSISVYGYNK